MENVKEIQTMVQSIRTSSMEQQKRTNRELGEPTPEGVTRMATGQQITEIPLSPKGAIDCSEH